jgi:hypothetical protein
MAVIRPFRALRPVPARVNLAHIVCDLHADAAVVAAAAAVEPRHLGRLLMAADDAAALDFGVADMLRAGVLERDALPTVTVVRQTKDDEEHTALFAAVRADNDGFGDRGDDATAPKTAVVVAPAIVHFEDKKGRIARAIEAETEREPDASFSFGGAAVEVWAVDDESASARITSLLEGATLKLNASGRGPWDAARALEGSGVTPWALACFVGSDADRPPVPVGLVLLAQRGPLARDDDGAV